MYQNGEIIDLLIGSYLPVNTNLRPVLYSLSALTQHPIWGPIITDYPQIKQDFQQKAKNQTVENRQFIADVSRINLNLIIKADKMNRQIRL